MARAKKRGRPPKKVEEAPKEEYSPSTEVECPSSTEEEPRNFELLELTPEIAAEDAVLIKYVGTGFNTDTQVDRAWLTGEVISVDARTAERLLRDPSFAKAGDAAPPIPEDTSKMTPIKIYKDFDDMNRQELDTHARDVHGFSPEPAVGDDELRMILLEAETGIEL